MVLGRKLAGPKSIPERGGGGAGLRSATIKWLMLDRGHSTPKQNATIPNLYIIALLLGYWSLSNHVVLMMFWVYL